MLVSSRVLRVWLQSHSVQGLAGEGTSRSLHAVLVRRCALSSRSPIPGTSLPSPEALQAKLGTLSLAAQEKLEKDVAKKEAKAEAKADAAMKKKMSSQVRYLDLELGGTLLK